MTIRLTPQQHESIQGFVRTGTFVNEAQVIDEALHLLKQREDLRAMVDEGIKQLDNGQYRTYGPGEVDRFVRDIEEASDRLSEDRRQRRA
jgi:Arc/MetJ-type ribon-helix-helix transcriptional regulator